MKPRNPYLLGIIGNTAPLHRAKAFSGGRGPQNLPRGAARDRAPNFAQGFAKFQGPFIAISCMRGGKQNVKSWKTTETD